MRMGICTGVANGMRATFGIVVGMVFVERGWVGMRYVVGNEMIGDGQDLADTMPHSLLHLDVRDSGWFPALS